MSGEVRILAENDVPAVRYTRANDGFSPGGLFLGGLDMDMALDNIVPESFDWRHTDEGPE